MACFYVIYRYVFSKWRSIRPLEINQYDITMATPDITMGNDVARDSHCDVTISNGIAMCTCGYEPLLLWILCSMPKCVILFCIVWNKNKNKFVFDQSGLENTFIVFVWGYFSSFGLVKYLYTNNNVFSPDWTNTH